MLVPPYFHATFSMIDQSEEYTKLLDLVTSHLLRSPLTCRQIQQKIHSEILSFNVIGKDSSLYVTDLLSSIQVEYRNKNLNQTSVALCRNPFNKFASPYYQIKDKRWHPFNCRPDILQQEKIDYNCPYQPVFYFKQSYPQFIVEKKKKNLHALNCNRITISKWRWKLVNINATGWYAPIIQAITYKVDQNTIRQQFYEVSCILYEQGVRLLMQRLRLQEMRQKDGSKLPHQSNSISMLYYLRDAQEPSANKRYNNIFKTDASKQLLNHNKENAKFVLFGDNEEGILTLSEKMSAKAIQLDKLKNMNLQNIKILFNNNTINPTPPQDSGLWSSSDQQSDSQQPQEPQIPVITLDESSESSEDEDPLRHLYIRKFQHLSLSLTQ